MTEETKVVLEEEENLDWGPVDEFEKDQSGITEAIEAGQLPVEDNE